MRHRREDEANSGFEKAVIRILASLLRLNRAGPVLDTAAQRNHAPDTQLQDDVLGEYLRGSHHADLAPEVLLRIL